MNRYINTETVVVAAAMVLIAPLAFAQSEDQTAAGKPRRHLPANAGISISPTTSLENLRFVFAVNGHLCVDIEGDTPRTQKLIESFHGNLYNTGFGTLLSGPQVSEVCAQLSVSVNDSYVVVLPKRAQAVKMELTTIATYCEEAGGRFGIWGVLDSAPIDTEDENEFFPVGIAYRSTGEPAIAFSQVAEPGKQNSDLMTHAIALRNNRDIKLLESLVVPDKNLALTTVRIDDSDYLYYFRLSEAAPKIVPIVTYWENDAMMVEERPGDHCGAMHDSSVWILPDINGDGVSEIFIRSTVSYILDPAPALKKRDGTSMAIVAKSYFGP